MNKLTLLVIAALALCGVTVGSASAQAPVPLVRYENWSKGESLLTTNPAELNGQLGWVRQGTQGYVFTQPSTVLVTLYRYYHAGLGNHFYTTNYNELRDGAGGWVRRENAGYVFATQLPGTFPLYRFTNPAGKHFYTTYKREGEAKYTEGYRLENITAYIIGEGGGPTVTPGDGVVTPPNNGPVVGPRTDLGTDPGSSGGPSVTGTGRTDVTSSGEPSAPTSERTDVTSSGEGPSSVTTSGRTDVTSSGEGPSSVTTSGRTDVTSSGEGPSSVTTSGRTDVTNSGGSPITVAPR